MLLKTLLVFEEKVFKGETKMKISELFNDHRC